jgi:hypothetical protein
MKLSAEIRWQNVTCQIPFAENFEELGRNIDHALAGNHLPTTGLLQRVIVFVDEVSK